MNGEHAYTKRPVDFTYPSEGADWHADNPPRSTKYMRLSKNEYLETLQKDFNEEYNQFIDFLTGKLLDGKGNPMSKSLYYVWANKKLFYIENPEFFEKAVTELRRLARLDDELDTILSGGKAQSSCLTKFDEAWITNTRQLIAKYHAIVEEHEKEREEKIERRRAV